MAKRRVEYILNECLPEPSKLLYQKKWAEFIEFIGEDCRPREDDYLHYFDYLHTTKKLKASTIWTTYSCLNSIHQQEFAEKLQVYPRITQLLKTYNNSYTRKVAPIFETTDLDRFLRMDLATPYWLASKAVVSITLSGGLRSVEMREINVSDVVKVDDCYEVTLIRTKQGTKTLSVFTVPESLSIYVRHYLIALKAVLGRDVSGPLIKGAPKGRFVNQPMGKNLLCSIGRSIAEVLNLDNADTFTGHCFLRTAVAMALDGGATTQHLQKTFGWKNIHTAKRYMKINSAGTPCMANIRMTKTIQNTGCTSNSTCNKPETDNCSNIYPSKLLHQNKSTDDSSKLLHQNKSTDDSSKLLFQKKPKDEPNSENYQVYHVQSTGENDVYDFC